MDWYQMAVFLYVGALTHFLADLLSHYKKKGALIFLHCFMYAIFFIPLFWWQGVNFLWLFLLFFSHLTIDLRWKKLLSFFDAMTEEQQKLGETTLMILTIGLDQILHLLTILIIAIFAL